MIAIFYGDTVRAFLAFLRMKQRRYAQLLYYCHFIEADFRLH